MLELTREIYDNIKKAVAEMEAGLKDYDTQIAELNSRRTEALNNYETLQQVRQIIENTLCNTPQISCPKTVY